MERRVALRSEVSTMQEDDVGEIDEKAISLARYVELSLRRGGGSGPLRGAASLSATF